MDAQVSVVPDDVPAYIRRRRAHVFNSEKVVSTIPSVIAYLDDGSSVVGLQANVSASEKVMCSAPSTVGADSIMSADAFATTDVCEAAAGAYAG